MHSNLVTELSLDEIDAVSGAGLFGSIIGNTIKIAVDASNGVLNAVAPLGQALNNTIPGYSAIHKLGDQIIAGGQDLANSLGDHLGAQYTPSNPNHYRSEWQGA